MQLQNDTNRHCNYQPILTRVNHTYRHTSEKSQKSKMTSPTPTRSIAASSARRIHPTALLRLLEVSYMVNLWLRLLAPKIHLLVTH